MSEQIDYEERLPKQPQEFVDRWLEHIRRMKIAGAKTKKEAAA